MPAHRAAQDDFAFELADHSLPHRAMRMVGAAVVNLGHEIGQRFPRRPQLAQDIVRKSPHTQAYGMTKRTSSRVNQLSERLNLYFAAALPTARRLHPHRRGE